MEEVRALLGARGPRGVPSNAAQEASAGRWHLKEWLLAVHQRRGVGIVGGVVIIPRSQAHLPGGGLELPLCGWLQRS